MIVKIEIKRININESMVDTKTVEAVVTITDKNQSFNVEISDNRFKLLPTNYNNRLPEISNHTKEYIQNVLKAYLTALISKHQFLIRIDECGECLPELEDE